MLHQDVVMPNLQEEELERHRVEAQVLHLAVVIPNLLEEELEPRLDGEPEHL